MPEPIPPPRPPDDPLAREVLALTHARRRARREQARAARVAAWTRALMQRPPRVSRTDTDRWSGVGAALDPPRRGPDR